MLLTALHNNRVRRTWFSDEAGASRVPVTQIRHGVCVCVCNERISGEESSFCTFTWRLYELLDFDSHFLCCYCGLSHNHNKLFDLRWFKSQVLFPSTANEMAKKPASSACLRVPLGVLVIVSGLFMWPRHWIINRHLSAFLSLSLWKPFFGLTL